MRLLGSLPWRYQAVPLSLIAAMATVVALFALWPSLAQGQVNASPATMKECKEELAAERAVLCKKNSFSVKTMLPDGGYHIDWSAWASRQSNIDRYTVQRLRFLYRYNFELEVDGTVVDASDYAIPDVSSCRPRAAEMSSMWVVDRWAWSCQGISNIHEDPFGQPTAAEQLVAFDDNRTSASWTGSLMAPGRKHDVAMQAFRIPGSQTEAHVANPQSAGDRLTQQQVDDGTHDLLASEVEMHLYYITVHFDDGTILRRYELVDGGSFGDRQ